MSFLPQTRYLFRLAWLALAVASCHMWPASGHGQIAVEGMTFGNSVRFQAKAYLGDQIKREDFATTVINTLDEINQRMSTYVPESEVSRFNASTSTDWFPVSDETARVVERAQEISRACDGAFDITVQPLVKLWNFGPDKKEFQVPDEQEIQAKLEQIGYRHLEVRQEPAALRKDIPQLQIDLSAIAKGYAVDVVTERLMELGVENFLVEIGGEVRAIGQKPDGSSWVVGVEEPRPGRPVLRRKIELQDRAIASSGDYRNFYEKDGKRYSHTINPTTGHPVDNQVATASVLADDCATADAIATALMVLGEEQGLKFAKEMDVQAMILRRQGDEIVASQTDDFPGQDIQRDTEQSMIHIILISAGFFLFALLAMAVGVFFGRQRIRGSCGGIANLDNPDVAADCSVCSRASECDELKDAVREREASGTGSS